MNDRNRLLECADRLEREAAELRFIAEYGYPDDTPGPSVAEVCIGEGCEHEALERIPLGEGHPDAPFSPARPGRPFPAGRATHHPED